MALLLLIRHAVTELTGRRLYGRSPGIPLSAAGREQARRLAERLREIPIVAVYASPLERCVETARAVAEGRDLDVVEVPDLTEVDVGRWTNRSLAWLVLSPSWRRVRRKPSEARFPGGESLAEVQRRTVWALDRIARRHAGQTVAAVSHGDPIRLALAHYLGMDLDHIRRMHVAAASVSAVSVGDGDPRVLRVSATGGLDDLEPG